MALPLRPLALAYRVVAVLLIALGVNNLIDPFTANPNWISLLYFTALSNLLALAWMIVVTVATARDLVKRGARGVTNPSPEFHGAVMMTVTVTLLVYTIVLAPTSDSGYVPYTWDDSLMHVIMPVLVIVDWLVFTPKGRMRWVDPLLWALIPASYLVFSFTFSAFGGDFGLGRRYPYPFMNLDILGLGGVVLWIAGLAVALVSVGYAYVAIDMALARWGSARDTGEPRRSDVGLAAGVEASA